MAIMNIDEVLQSIGEFGKYQWLLAGIATFAGVASAFTVMVVTFITAEPDWICVKGYNSSICNFTEPISLTSKHYKTRCDMPREAWTYVEGFTSTVTEYDLVCDKSLLQSLSQSCFWVGVFVGLLIGGYLSDRFGRRIVFSAGYFLVIVATWIMIFPKDFIFYIVCRIFVGIGYGLQNGSSYILYIEYTTSKHRARFGMVTGCGWVSGALILLLISYYIPAWRITLLVTAALFSPLLSLRWILPESIRWLLSHGKEEEAKIQLKKVAKINGKPFPAVDLEKPQISENGSFKHLFYNWQTTKTTLISWNIWFTVSLVYYGVSYGSVDLGGNRYLNFALTSLVELPASFAMAFCTSRYGRKITVLIGLVVAFIATVISVAIPSDRSNAGYNGSRVFMTVIAKFSIYVAFSGIYLWSSELFPTIVRSKGFSTSSAAARIGSFSASYIIWLIRIHPLLPYGIMAAICFQAAVFGTFLPETMSTATMESMDDMVKCEKKQYSCNVQARTNEAADTPL